MRIARIFLVFFLLANVADAQHNPTEQELVMRPITGMFKAMTLGDSAMAHQSFMDGATLTVIGADASGNADMRTMPLADFLKAIGTPHDETWNEPIWAPKISIDGNMAMVWTDYAFFRGKNFSHCGVDTFQLFKGASGWKIFNLVYTRQTEGCNVPPPIKNQFK